MIKPVLTSPLHLLSTVYKAAASSTKLHIYIRQKTAPLHIFWKDTPAPGPVLEYGCGHGLILAGLSVLYPEVKLYGLDHDARKCAVVQQCLPGVSLLTPPDLSGPYANFFNRVMIADVLYCNSPQQQAEILQTVYTAMKPGATLLLKETVNTPRLKYYWCLLQEFVVIKILKLTKGEQTSLPDPACYTHLLANCGFKNITEQPVHRGYVHPHYLFTAVK